MPNDNEEQAVGNTISYISLDTAVRLLKEYNGETKSDKAHDFIDSCDMVFSSVNPDNHEILFNIIKTKLTGKARSLTKYKQFFDWVDLKDYLEDVFSEKRSISFWQLELNSCKQSRQEEHLLQIK
ncbi:unnamed protein product [Brassicogethes aeneus]|uniref:Uncharacterized protein n=1 Tax=Brassicogethes aeneus TaxID=1431903 RepID=A0A9P0FPD1_BRAAE|nr:unnamed protein product [Brassicogethes aeneus]